MKPWIGVSRGRRDVVVRDAAAVARAAADGLYIGGRAGRWIAARVCQADGRKIAVVVYQVMIADQLIAANGGDARSGRIAHGIADKLRMV